MTTPPRRDKTPLHADAITSRLAKLPKWEGDQQALRRTYTFDSFLDAVDFISRLAPHAEELDHHPELFNVYDRVEVTLTTHDAGGVTALDFELAARLDDLFQA